MAAFIQVTFPGIQTEQQEVLIAHLTEAGFEGFEENKHELKAFIAAEKYDKPLLNELVFKYQLTYTDKKIDEQNWNALWESNFHPVIVDDFAAIRADFHTPVKGVEYEIVITPKMSFGTGHHATTFMMIQQMRGIEFAGKRVFDFGTGTGILAILAEKLGAQSIVAVDNDDWSIANTTENLERNHCSRVTVKKAESIIGPGKYDIILANINKNVIQDSLVAMADHLVPGRGILLLSGLLEADEQEILEDMGKHTMQLVDKLVKTGWICLKISC